MSPGQAPWMVALLVSAAVATIVVSGSWRVTLIVALTVLAAGAMLVLVK